MKRQRSRIIISVIVVMGLISAGVALAAPLAFGLSWWTLDGGGGTSSGGGYTLSGTFGQADAGHLSGGDYILKGGFWGGIWQFLRVYLPMILKL